MSGVQTATFSRFDSCVDETLTMRALECGLIHSLQESWSRRLGRRVFGPGVLKSWVDNLVSGLPFQPGINVFRGFGLENKMGCDLFEELLERHFVASVRKSRVPLGCQVLTLMRFPITIHLGLDFLHASSMASSVASTDGPLPSLETEWQSATRGLNL